MTRITIEIEDIAGKRVCTIETENIADKRACQIATSKLYTALIDHYGKDVADLIWFLQVRDMDLTREKEPHTLSRALEALPFMENQDKRLVLEYYAMEKPSKTGLAKELAHSNVVFNKRNKELAAERRLWNAQKEHPWHLSVPYGPTGTTSWETMLQQIKRVFRKHKAACAVIGAAPPELRQVELVRVRHALREPARGTKQS